jgi:outer membrane lipoprotein-sorting protein
MHYALRITYYENIMKYVLRLLLASILCVLPAAAQVPTGEEVLQRIDENMVVDQAISQTTMIIHARTGDRTITSKALTKGEDKAFVEYLSPAREKGKKMLRVEDTIWNYTPEPHDRIITISGHLLRQSVMGSDMSYEDMTENREMIDMYDAVVEGEEEMNGRPCYVLQLTAKEEGLSYHSRKLWVDHERWLPVREERFAKSGKLLKTTNIVEMFQIDERWYPKKMIFKDELARGEGTEYIINSIDFDVEIPEHMLTKAALRK